MSRIRIQGYGPSKSAKALSEYLGITRLKSTGSRFRGRQGDLLVNWGVVKNVHSAATYANPIAAVHTASNKLSTFRKLKEADVSIPTFGTDCTFADDSSTVVARTTLSGHSGEGIVIGQPNELPNAPLYTEYIEKVAEYRAIVVNGKVVDFKQKLKKKSKSEENPEGFDGEHDKYVWNVSGGYIFARNGIRHPEEADVQAIKACEAIGLRYAAIDLIEDEEGVVYVLEANTACGLEGATIALVGDAMKELVEELQD